MHSRILPKRPPYIPNRCGVFKGSADRRPFFFQTQPLFSLTMAPFTTAHDRCTTARVRAQKCRLRIGKTTQHQHWRGRSGTTVKDPDNEETVDTHSDVASEAAFTGGCVGGSMPSWTKPNLQYLFSEKARRWLRGPLRDPARE